MALVQVNEAVAQTVSVANRQATENLALLQQMTLFEAVPVEAVRALAAVTKQVSIGATEAIFRDGDPGDRVFFVCSGEVEISLTNLEKTKITLEIETSGDFFGEVGALQGNRRSASAYVLQQTVALMVAGENLKSVLRQHPDPDIMLPMYTQTA